MIQVIYKHEIIRGSVGLDFCLVKKNDYSVSRYYPILISYKQ